MNNPELVQHPASEHPYITSVTGVNIGSPAMFLPEHVRMVDIRRSLSKLCRFNGHVDRFYSVAEHSVLVSEFAEEMGDSEAMLPGLLHDAHEAYTGDIPSPQKNMIEGFHLFETRMERTVRAALKLPPNEHPVWKRVRVYDTLILHRELKALRAVLPDWYDPDMEAKVPVVIQPVGHEWPEAEGIFRERLHRLRPWPTLQP